MPDSHDHQAEVAMWGRCFTCNPPPSRNQNPEPRKPARTGALRRAATPSEQVAAATTKVSDQQGRILAVLAEWATATGYEISGAVEMSPNQVATRLLELRTAGLAEWITAETLEDRADSAGYLVAETTPGNTGRLHRCTAAGLQAVVSWRARNLRSEP